MKILSINMWILPFGLSVDNKKRIESLISFIRENKPDIIALQEIWLKRYIYSLKKLNYFLSYNKGKLRNYGGLVLLTKEKPIKKEFFPFLNEKGIVSKLAKKGILKVSLSKIDILNTHLYNKTEEKQGLKIAYNEFNFLKSKINKNKLSIVCGDLNIEKNDFEKINKNFFYYLENVENTFSSENKYIKKWWEKKVKADKKIDYILCNKKLKFKSEVIKSYNNQFLSDHYGILTEVFL